MTDLTGNEQVTVLGQTPTGGPASDTFITTTAEIANLATVSAYFTIIPGTPNTLQLAPPVGYQLTLSTAAGTNINLVPGVDATACGSVASVMLAAPAGSNLTGGGFDLEAGQGDGTGAGGSIYIQTGFGGDSGDGGAMFFQCGEGGATAGDGGSYGAQGGSGHSPTGQGGGVTFRGGDGLGTNGLGGDMIFLSGTGNGTGRGGDITLNPGGANGSGRKGRLIVVNLPTADPHVVGVVWLNSGVMTVSAG